ncbi:hypothetical protein HCN44_004959 [Aphidius gifuensis]|uniref:KATNIP domain-containing protein n=1 Tax=Aphidius gifuensis TaxID=684658 RepID=A0A835CTR9_APHGI|nr:hypothetical protein HCN44_004959 [Aphidius gifuensis]
MKLPITSLVIIAVGFGLFGWINATPLSTVDSVENFSKETSTSSDNFLVYVNSSGLFTLPFSKKNKNLSEIEITDSSSFSGTFDSKNSHNKEFTISCANNNIYILKKSKEDERKVLDIINYNDNNEFKRINQVSDMFNNATSIASDRKTGNIYWIECNNKKQYSIKVTNESFKESKYIINPRKEIAMSVIHIYPKRDLNNIPLKKEMSSLSLQEKKYNTVRKKSVDITPKREKIIEFDLRQQDDELEDFVIPELPSGQLLKINIISTWGDRHYVGLNGIEIFSSTGEPPEIIKIWYESSDDPNDFQQQNNNTNNLINGIYRTRDDLNIWRVPFTSGNNHIIYIKFANIIKIGLIRIWNYNKSRIHSYQGAKNIIIKLDNCSIFSGEIARACGDIVGNINSFGDTILFTIDDNILEMISINDTNFLEFIDSSSTEEKSSTAVDLRPSTAATDYQLVESKTTEYLEESIQSSSSNDKSMSISCREIKLILLSNWNSSEMIGLNGIEIMTDHGVIPSSQMSLSCQDDNETIDRLIDGNNMTMEPKYMWISRKIFDIDITIIITLNAEEFLTGIRIWNYNESLESSYFGVKQMMIELDGKKLFSDDFEGFELRRAPGCSTPVPQGFIYQILIFSTWGDAYYVGLNGIELFGAQGEQIFLTKKNIAAYPESVNIIMGMENDVRTPDKLIDEINDNNEGQHSWLAPILPGEINRIYIFVDDLLVYNGSLEKDDTHGEIHFSTNDNSNFYSPMKKPKTSEQEIHLLNFENIATLGSDDQPDPLLRPFTSNMPKNSRNYYAI